MMFYDHDRLLKKGIVISEYYENPTLVSALIFINNKAHQYFERDEARELTNRAVSIANTLKIAWGGNNSLIAGGMLSNILETAQSNIEEISSIFGDEACSLVIELTDTKSQSRSDRQQNRIDRIPNLSHDARLIEMAVCLYELTFIPKSWTDTQVAKHVEKVRAIANALAKTDSRLYELILHRLHAITDTNEPKGYIQFHSTSASEIRH